jgi:hypothetical protein
MLWTAPNNIAALHRIIASQAADVASEREARAAREAESESGTKRECGRAKDISAGGNRQNLNTDLGFLVII